MIATQPPMSCVLVGHGTLLLRCAELLAQRGWTVAALLSDDGTVQQQAALQMLPVHPTTDLLAVLGAQPVDYLFSIANLAVLPDAALHLPRRGAVNYHDGPLPRYAGMYVTSWAILNGETEHGISWHLMTAQVDAGPLLLQRTFALAPDETALSLNLKCYDAAIESFSVLLAGLEAGTLAPQPQDESQRSYFGRTQRPPAQAVLDWRAPAQELSRLVRALDFGSYPNPLLLPRLALPAGNYLAVGTLAVLPAPATQPPGTLLAVEADRLLVAAADQVVALGRLRTLAGQPVAPPATGLAPGSVLPLLSDAQRAELTRRQRTLSRAEPFWLARLASMQPATLPLLAAPDQPADAPARTALDVPAAFTAWLARADVDCPPEVALLAAFALYLARVGNGWACDIGLQPPAPSADLAALEAEVVPLRLELNAQWDAPRLITAVQQQLATTRAQGTYARDLLARTPHLAPLPLSVTVALADAPTAAPALPPGSRLHLVCPPGNLAASVWLYDPASLSAAAITEMHTQFCTLLAGLAAQPEEPLAHVPLLAPAALQELVTRWQRLGQPYPHTACVHDLLAAQAARTPDAYALRCGPQQLSYRELDTRANALAAALQQQGVGPGVLVALAAERTPELLVGLLAVLKAGGAYVPLDPDFPAERLAFMLADAQVAVLLTQSHLLPRLPQQPAPVLLLDAAYPVAPPVASSAQASDLAYVIYTSGSTGRPKGVPITHRAVVNFLCAMREQPGIGPDDRLLAVTTLSFDIAVLELLLPLFVGAQVVMVPRTVASDGRRLAAALDEHAATLMQATPATWRMLVQAGWQGRAGLRMLCGGEALPPDLAAALLPLGAELWNMYGPTETTIWSTTTRVTTAHEAPPLGAPIANTALYVLDESGQPVPPGVVGELYIGGDGLARGYLNRPELTAERFVPDPFAPLLADAADAPRMYRTGDLVCVQPGRPPDTALLFLGRADQQVKLRGFRIELHEIEATLNQHPAVHESVALVREDTPGDQRLVAYVVLHEPAPPLHELRTLLAAHLPGYMIPAALVQLPALPLTPNGKRDRAALPMPTLSRSALAAPYAAPQTPTEITLAAIWAEALHSDPPGLHDSFFALGGHSLLATRVLARVRDSMQVDMPLYTMFEYPTLAALAEQIDTVRWHTHARLSVASNEDAAEREEGAI